jgi:hypothetical protein
MRFLRWFAVFVAVAAALVSESAQAGGLGWLWRDINVGYHRNKYWPEPFIMQDRAFVAAPFVVMTRKGWEEQNLMGDNYFNKQTGKLNESGQLKVRWILTQAPVGYRTIYIEKADTPQQTADRMEVARQFADRIAIGGEVPDVRESNMPVTGWPAEYSDMIINKFNQSTPDPRLPADADSGAGAGAVTQ